MNKRILWKKIKQRGAIIWGNTDGIMRDAGNIYAYADDGNLTEEIVDTMPRTYKFKGVPAYDSYSALFPVGNKKNPFEYTYFTYDEDENRAGEWTTTEIRNPLSHVTEKEYVENLGEHYS